ncbi:MAG: hypothetical protein KAT15_19835, partial [Bacteroidales bacterium]|nr:hypothetical protein [Bacteroidales bacterium]
SDAMFQGFKETLQYAGGDAEIIVWHQGYSDSKKFIGNPAGYEMAMDVLYNRIKELIPRNNLPVICGVEGRKHMLIDVESLDKEYLDEGWNHVRWSQMRWAEKHDYVYNGPNAIDIRIRDGGHFHFRDRLTWASQMTQCVLYVLGEEKYSGGGIFFDNEQCSLDRNIITLKVKHQGGNRLVLPFPEKSIDGFIVKGKGIKSPLKIKEVKIVQPDKVKIVLQEVPKNRVFLGYLSGECPISDIDLNTTTTACMEKDSNDPPGNILYDNAQLPPGNMHEKLGLGNMVNGTIGYMEFIPDYMQDLLEMVKQNTGFVKNWMVIGSFDTEAKGYSPTVVPPGFDKEYPPEKEIKFTKTYSGMNGDVQWKKAITSENGLLDFNTAYSPNKGAIAYAYAEIESPDNRKTLITLGSDDGAKVWINKELVYSKHIWRGAVPDDEFIDVQLKKGKNTILVKIENRGAGWEMIVRLVDPEGELRISKQH